MAVMAIHPDEGGFGQNIGGYASAGLKSKTPIWLEQIIIALITNPYA